MANKVQKPSRERGLLSGGLVALTFALALVASLLYAQPLSGLIGGLAQPWSYR